MPPSIMPSTPSHRKTSGWTCIAHPPSWLLQKRPNGDSPGCAPPRACSADTPRYGGGPRFVRFPRCDARPIRRVGRSDSRSATSDCASDGFRIRTSFLKKAESRLARWQADTGCGPSDWSTGYQFGFSSRAPIRDDSGFRKPSTREHHSRKGAKILVNRLSTISVVTKNPDCPRYFGPISVPAPRRCHPW